MLEKFLIGTYTKKTSEGVYEMTLDTSKKRVTQSQSSCQGGESNLCCSLQAWYFICD